MWKFQVIGWNVALVIGAAGATFLFCKWLEALL